MLPVDGNGTCLSQVSCWQASNIPAPCAFDIHTWLGIVFQGVNQAMTLHWPPPSCHFWAQWLQGNKSAQASAWCHRLTWREVELPLQTKL